MITVKPQYDWTKKERDEILSLAKKNFIGTVKQLQKNMFCLVKMYIEDGTKKTQILVIDVQRSEDEKGIPNAVEGEMDGGDCCICLC